MIQGYPETTSVYPGQSINLFVSTNAIQFQIDFYRQGVTLELQFTSPVLKGDFAPDHSFADDWGQDGQDGDGNLLKGCSPYAIEIPDNLQTGVYIAMFYECDVNGIRNPVQDPPVNTANSYAPTGKAMFIIMNPYPGYDSQLLYKIPLFTYQAYNWKGGGSIYQLVSTSFSRPGIGTGGIPWDARTGNLPNIFNAPYGNWDPYDNYSLDPVNNSPRQVFEHWDAKFISFLEGLGYRIDYCTDMDIHNDNGELLKNYSLVLSVGHDEYYTAPMRDNLQNFINNGGNIAFFSGNTCYWQAKIQDGTPQIMIGQQTIHLWSQTAEAEDGFTGVAFVNAGERNAGGAPDQNYKVSLGYTVQNTNTWPFENTGLNNKDHFGNDQGLIGYESDGAIFDDGGPMPYQPSQGSSTPAGFMILGYANTNAFKALGSNAFGTNYYLPGNHYATMGMYTNNGTVFTGATTDWPRVAWEGEPSTAQITQNVIDRLGGNPKGLAELSNVPNIICIDGFFSGDDNYRHAIVGDSDGNIIEIFFNPGPDQVPGQAFLKQIDGLIDLGAFFTPDDNNRHVIAIDPTGTITEIFFNPDTGIFLTPIGNIAGAERVCAYYSSDDQFRHAIISTTDGTVFDIRYGIGLPQQTQVGAFDDIIDIGCFFSPDDSNGHVIVATGDGAITEIYYSADHHISQTQIAVIEGAVKVSAYYATGDNFFTRRAQVLANDGRIHEIRYGRNTTIVHVVLMTIFDVTDIGGFYSDDDGFSHSILSYDTGDVRELFFWQNR